MSLSVIIARLKILQEKFHFQSKKCVILRIFFTCLTEAFIIFTDPLTGRAITLVGIFTMVLDIRLTRLCSGFKSFEKSLEMIYPGKIRRPDGQRLLQKYHRSFPPTWSHRLQASRQSLQELLVTDRSLHKRAFQT